MKTVGTLHGGKAKIGKTRRYRQHRQQHHALPALALQMFIFLFLPSPCTAGTLTTIFGSSSMA